MKGGGLTPDVEYRLDEMLSGMAVFENAEEVTLAPILPINFVLAQKYRGSFPHHTLEGMDVVNGGAKFMLSPTCCYPIFHLLQGTSFCKDALYTNKSHCFRNELECIEGVRQLSFKMREYVFISSDVDVVYLWIDRVKIEIPQALGLLGIQVETVKATDPFFNPLDFQQLLQKSENLKSEFVHNGVSLASVNLHLKAFSRSCGLLDESGKHVYTACFGLGYDRVSSCLRSAALE